jgi:phage I-like protein
VKELCAHVAIAAPDSPDGEFMYMPAGITQGNFKLNQKIPVTAKILVNKNTATALNQQLASLAAKSPHRPYFDFNHEDSAASFWPQSFEWRETPLPGIYAKGEWSAKGKQAIEGKEYRSFSGVFHVDDLKKDPAIVMCNPEARLNMGGFVNAPAFKTNLPLWAKDQAEPGPDNDNNSDTNSMKRTLAELQASLTTLTETVTGLTAKAGTDETAKTELAAKQSELESLKKDVRIAELEAKQLENNKSLAKSTVQSAIKRGIIKSQDKEIQAKWEEKIVADPLMAAMLDAFEGGGAGLMQDITRGQRTTGNGGALEAKDGVNRCAKAYGELMAKNHAVGVHDIRGRMDLARQAAMLFKKELSGADLSAVLLELQAADNTDANLGVLTGTLVAQRTMELFRLKFPLLKYVWTDFSELQAALNQQIESRIVVVPGTQLYDNTVNAQTGEPNGWSYVTLPQTTDVPIKMDTLVGCPIRFGLDILSSTARRLFDEQSPGAAYAMAKYFVQKLYALLTPANFNAYAAGGTAKVPDAFATYAVAQADFARSSLTRLESIFDPNEVPEDDRYVLLNAKYHAQLGNDPTITQFYAAVRKPEIIEETDLPKMAGFKPIKAPNLTANNATPNLVGFAGHKAALAIAARLPVDLNQVLPGAMQGSVITLVDSELGIPWQLVQFVSQVKGYAQWQLQSLMGCNKGDNRGGLCMTSQ